MALDAAEAMLIGRLQQSVEGLERVVDSLRLAVDEFREAYAEAHQTLEGRITALETDKATAKAHKAGLMAGYSVGKKVGVWSVLVAAAWGLKSGAVDVVELISRIGK